MLRVASRRLASSLWKQSPNHAAVVSRYQKDIGSNFTSHPLFHVPATGSLPGLKKESWDQVSGFAPDSISPRNESCSSCICIFCLDWWQICICLLRLLILKFILSTSAGKDVLAPASLDVDLSSIEPGATVTVKWRRKPVFISIELRKILSWLTVLNWVP